MREERSWLRNAVKSLLPPKVHAAARRRYGSLVFRRELDKLKENPSSLAEDLDVARKLRYGWSNGWSASPEYLQTAAERLRTSPGPVLDCGSGLSTIVLGVLADSLDCPVWSLEHDPKWAELVTDLLRRNGIQSVTIDARPLKSYGAYDWYDPSLAKMPAQFSLVLCDGPPGTTFGGRYGLLPVVGSRLAANCVILVDDASRPDERQILERWNREFECDAVMHSASKPFVELSWSR